MKKQVVVEVVEPGILGSRRIEALIKVKGVKSEWMTYGRILNMDIDTYNKIPSKSDVLAAFMKMEKKNKSEERTMKKNGYQFRLVFKELSYKIRYFLTDWFGNGTLEEYLAKKRRKLGSDIDILIDVATALNELHEAGIMHRDIKPENVCLKEDHSGRLRAYLIDLGLAREIPEEGERIEVAGSARREFLAPELEGGLRGEFPDGLHYKEEVDVYSFGKLMDYVYRRILSSNDEESQQIWSDLIAGATNTGFCLRVFPLRVRPFRDDCVLGRDWYPYHKMPKEFKEFFPKQKIRNLLATGKNERGGYRFEDVLDRSSLPQAIEKLSELKKLSIGNDIRRRRRRLLYDLADQIAMAQLTA